MSQEVITRKSLRVEWHTNLYIEASKVDSAKFHFANFEWRIRLEKSGTEGNCRVRVLLLKKDQRRCVLKVRTFIQGTEGSEFLSKDVNYIAESSLLWTEPMQNIRQIFTDCNATFVIILTACTTTKDEKAISVETDINIDQVSSLEGLSQDLKEDDNLCDIKLRCEEESFKAHKSILCARSSTFCDMIKNNEDVKSSGILTISNLKPQVLKQCLKFIYTGILKDMTVDRASELYQASNMYGIRNLSDFCFSFLKENLREDNVYGILAWAYANEVEEIKKCALSYIQKCRLLEEKDKWIEFKGQHPNLAAVVIYYLYKFECMAE